MSRPGASQPSTVRVVGSSLAGLAAAARLARHGHRVSISTPAPIGGRASAGDQFPPITTLPAAWRDLAKKSGRPMAGLLNSAHLQLVEAPPALHRFPDGTELRLPADRGGQVKAIASVFTRRHAEAWAELVDALDQVWQALRRHGTEAPCLPAKPDDPALLPSTTMAQLADRLDDERLQLLLLSAASRAGASTPAWAPALLGSRWSIERTFGRWQLLDSTQAVGEPMSRLTELLLRRLAEAGVTVELASESLVEGGGTEADGVEAGGEIAEALIDCQPATPTGRRWPWQPSHEPVRPPLISTTSIDASGALSTDIDELVEHSPSGRPRVTWTRRVSHEEAVLTTHDHTRPTDPDPAWGWTIDSFAQWRARPLLRPSNRPVWHASAASHAGNEPWAELLSGALVAYQVHEHLTGVDIRPTNKAAPRPPRRQQLG